MKVSKGNETIYRHSPSGLARIPGVCMTSDRDVQLLQETAHSAQCEYGPQTADYVPLVNGAVLAN